MPSTEKKLQFEGGSDDEKKGNSGANPIDAAEIELEEVKVDNARPSDVDRPSDLGLRSAMSYLENNQLPPSMEVKDIDESEDFEN